MPADAGRALLSGKRLFCPTIIESSVAVIVGILTSVFSITFLLLLYAKHYKWSAAESWGPYGSGGAFGSSGGTAGERWNSGVDRAVVELLPVFRFGALRGQKAGLECTVRLGWFEPTEAFRLLLKCRHGFHVECVDMWLDAHSTCPLCRSHVDPEDVLLLPEPPKPSTTGPPDPPETKLVAVAVVAVAALRPAPPPRLDLSSPSPFHSAAISRILASHRGDAVSFHLSLSQPSPADLDSWLRILARRHLQELLV
ncbi:hypothetical protein E2562_026384 [Oryza meyeriana var. granulata]|uniref:RING-type E3 ubiquitin transferase n=1 Tax=Oryza meyeriana var. granulata TaxID=110450 RepID=A0A6G1DQQ8_9ORYZ|nr:hypothetical protein E2562_026384 [Oryza meyeriana var. granulata]